MSDLPLFRKNAPETSRKAANRIKGYAPTQRQQVLNAITESGAYGMTDSELEDALEMRAQSVSPRRGELAKLGAIADSGERQKTASGRPAVVWVLPHHLHKQQEGGTNG